MYFLSFLQFIFFVTWYEEHTMVEDLQEHIIEYITERTLNQKGQ